MDEIVNTLNGDEKGGSYRNEALRMKLIRCKREGCCILG